MNVLITGASGMVGQAVLQGCLQDPAVRRILLLGRKPLNLADPRVHEILRADLADLAGLEPTLEGLDACFYCMGVSSAGLPEPEYERLTYRLAVEVGETLARLSPGMTLVYVSGAGTDSSEKGRIIWARIKGKTENALLALPLRAAYMLRPGMIVPMDGVRSSTRSYQLFYDLAKPVLPLLHQLFPRKILSSREIAEVMLLLARLGYDKPILETGDMRDLLNAQKTND